MTPKHCSCGQQGRCQDSRQEDEFVYRRYVCACGERWSTVEVRIMAPRQRGQGLKDRLQRQFGLTYLKDLVTKLQGEDRGPRT